MILSILGIFLTIYFENKSTSSTFSNNAPSMNEGMPGNDMSGFKGDDSTSRPEKPSGEDDSSRPSMPEGGSGMPSMDENKSGMPSMPGDSTNMPTMPESTTKELDTLGIIIISVCSLLFSASLIYMIQSKLCTIKVFSEKDKIIIYSLETVIVTVILSVGLVLLTNNYILGSETNNAIPSGGTNENVETTGKVSITDEESSDNESFSTTTSDESAIMVSDGGNYTVTDATINKTGDSSNTENSEFYGVNAAVLVKTGSTLSIKGSNITTNSLGSNAVFATGENAVINISDTVINTSSNSSRGLDATYGGTINADNVTINTLGTSCATLATDRGEGTVTATNSKLSTSGKGSPIIYSTGNITLNDSTGDATGSQLVVIEGKNSASVNNSTLTSNGSGNRNDVDNAGVMIYQSMSGDASEGTGTFSATDSTLTINESSSIYKTVPFFFITNTDAVINLNNTTINYGSNILLDAKGTSEWGNEGSNGGNVTLNATNQTLTGNITIDSISTLVLNLNSSTYTGTINGDNTAKSVTVNLDSSSTWNVTGNSYITSIIDSNSTFSNIKSNGYTIYYDKDTCTNLNGKTYDLDGGGKLSPL